MKEIKGIVDIIPIEGITAIMGLHDDYTIACPIIAITLDEQGRPELMGLSENGLIYPSQEDNFEGFEINKNDCNCGEVCEN